MRPIRNYHKLKIQHTSRFIYLIFNLPFNFPPNALRHFFFCLLLDLVFIGMLHNMYNHTKFVENLNINEAVILAGGLGTRLSEETGLRPKPMVEIGGKPILLHIMEYLSKFGINTFVICLGYKSEFIKSYFHNYLLTRGDIQIDMSNGSVDCLNRDSLDWKIKLIETGKSDMTGSRLRQAIKYINNDNFLFTYGDGLTNQDIHLLISSHISSNKLASITAVKPPGRLVLLRFLMIIKMELAQ